MHIPQRRQFARARHPQKRSAVTRKLPSSSGHRVALSHQRCSLIAGGAPQRAPLDPPVLSIASRGVWAPVRPGRGLPAPATGAASSQAARSLPRKAVEACVEARGPRGAIALVISRVGRLGWSELRRLRFLSDDLPNRDGRLEIEAPISQIGTGRSFDFYQPEAEFATG